MPPATLTTHHSPLTTHDLVLGIDGGGSRTVALLAPVAAADDRVEKEIVGRGVAGPSNYQAVGRDRALRALDDAVEAAFSSAGIARGQVAAACLGLAGADRPADRAMLDEWSKRVGLAASVRLENDGMLLLAAGTPSCWGVALIAGTGSIALARSPDGRTSRAGGWGYLFGDEGSAYAVAVAGLRAAARAADGRGPATILSERFCTRMQLDRVESLVPAVYGSGIDRAAIAGLADVVTNSAADRDAVAIAILESAADELVDMASAAARNISIESHAAVPLALAGGMLLGYEPLRVGVVDGLRRRGINAEPIQLVTEPALGAVRLARETLGQRGPRRQGLV